MSKVWHVEKWEYFTDPNEEMGSEGYRQIPNMQNLRISYKSLKNLSTYTYQ